MKILFVLTLSTSDVKTVSPGATIFGVMSCVGEEVFQRGCKVSFSVLVEMSSLPDCTAK